jgi:hypothetical protein
MFFSFIFFLKEILCTTHSSGAIWLFYISIDRMVSSMGRIGIGSNWHTHWILKGDNQHKQKYELTRQRRKMQQKVFYNQNNYLHGHKQLAH